MAGQKNLLTGDVVTIADKAVAVTIERYNELIKKEAFFDKLMEGNGINMYMYKLIEEGKGNAKPD